MSLYLKQVIIILPFLFTARFLSAQVPEKGLYGMADYTFLCLGDSLATFRLPVEGALQTYLIGTGRYEMSKRKIRIENLNISSMTSEISIRQRSDDSTGFQVLNLEGEPKGYVVLEILHEGERQFIKGCGPHGRLQLPWVEMESMEGSLVTIKVSETNYETRQILRIERGKDYIIKSTIPDRLPFVLTQEKLVLKIKDSGNPLKFELFGRTYELKKRTDRNCDYQDLLFNRQF